VAETQHQEHRDEAEKRPGKKIAMEEWAAGQLRWNPETDISTAGSSRPPTKPKHKASPKPKGITSVDTMKWNPNAPTKTSGTHKNNTQKKD
jgi:hypothetical protein